MTSPKSGEICDHASNEWFVCSRIACVYCCIIIPNYFTRVRLSIFGWIITCISWIISTKTPKSRTVNCWCAFIKINWGLCCLPSSVARALGSLLIDSGTLPVSKISPILGRKVAGSNTLTRKRIQESLRRWCYLTDQHCRIFLQGTFAPGLFCQRSEKN